MKKYKAEFMGRPNTSIGRFYFISTIIEAPNENEAWIRLYDRFEHITALTLEEIKE